MIRFVLADRGSKSTIGKRKEEGTLAGGIIRGIRCPPTIARLSIDEEILTSFLLLVAYFVTRSPLVTLAIVNFCCPLVTLAVVNFCCPFVTAVIFNIPEGTVAKFRRNDGGIKSLFCTLLPFSCEKFSTVAIDCEVQLSADLIDCKVFPGKKD